MVKEALKHKMESTLRWILKSAIDLIAMKRTRGSKKSGGENKCSLYIYDFAKISFVLQAMQAYHSCSMHDEGWCRVESDDSRGK